MSYYVYVLKSIKDGKFYVGMSTHPAKRLEEHNRGMTKSTKPRRPLELVYSEKCFSRIEARKLEKQLKSGYGREFLKSKFEDKS